MYLFGIRHSISNNYDHVSYSLFKSFAKHRYKLPDILNGKKKKKIKQKKKSTVTHSLFGWHKN